MPDFLALAVLAYLYPPGRDPGVRREIRFEAARVIRRAARAAS